MAISISSDKTYLTVSLGSGDRRFHGIWLRDHAQDPATVSPHNGQRLITLLDQPESIHIASATPIDGNILAVRFEEIDQVFQFPFHWLEQHCYDRSDDGEAHQAGWINQEFVLWDSHLIDAVPNGSFTEVNSNRLALGKWLAAVHRFGFALMTGLPENPDSLLDVTALFGYVRETNYGKCFDVRSEVDPVNLAYTGLGLQAHTDNPYRDPAPTMQILSCIENTASGGESIVVDGFHAAKILQQENPEHFDLLSGFCARFRYAGSRDVNLVSKRPMIELGVDGELVAVRFNNRSSAPLVDIPFEMMHHYYRAYRHFSEIIGRNDNQLTFRLEPNQLFIVENTRVMYSRAAFSFAGNRWLRGCYPDRDGMRSTLSVIAKEHPEARLTDSEI